MTQHLVETRFFHVEDFAAQGKDGLIATIAPLLRRAARRIALDQKQFAALRVLFLAVRQLAGQAA